MTSGDDGNMRAHINQGDDGSVQGYYARKLVNVLGMSAACRNLLQHASSMRVHVIDCMRADYWSPVIKNRHSGTSQQPAWPARTHTTQKAGTQHQFLIRRESNVTHIWF